MGPKLFCRNFVEQTINGRDLEGKDVLQIIYECELVLRHLLKEQLFLKTNPLVA
jgi:hypothetical protein